MIQFQGFKPSGMEKIANAMGFQGNMNDFQKFLNDNPDRQAEMMGYQNMARKMAEGGVVRMQQGGTTDVKTVGQTLPQIPIPQQNFEEGDDVTDITAKMLQTPALPTGAAVGVQGVGQDPSQLIEKGTGEVSGDVDVKTTTADTVKADTPTVTDANLVKPTTVQADVEDVVGAVEAAQADPNDPRLKIKAAEQTKSSVSNLELRKVMPYSWRTLSKERYKMGS